MTLRAGFCVSGSGSLFRAAVRHREQIGMQPAILIVETKAASDLEAFAETHGIPALRLDPRDRAAFDRQLTERLVAEELALLSLTFDRVLPAALVTALAPRIINVHPALLPSFAGMRGIERTLESGVRIGGATIHEVVEAVDAGPVIAQAALGVGVAETQQSYGARLYGLLEPMFLQVLRWYADGRVTHDARGRVVIRDARYDLLPIVPALEHFEAAP